MTKTMEEKSTGICSAHKYGEDKNCKTCYQEPQSLHLLDTLIRDITKIGFMSKGEARKRLEGIIQSAEATAYKKGRDEERERVKKLVEGMKKIPTKHERCTLDESWCYDHEEIMAEGTEPNGALSYNQALSDISLTVEKGEE